MLFADIAKSTQLTERLDAEAALGVIGPAIAAMSEAIERFGGTVVKATGDGLMAVFGIPVMLEDHAMRACHAALAIQQNIQHHAADVRSRHGTELRVRVGLNSGPVVVAAMGDARNPVHDAIGPTVHLAQRIESVAEPGFVCLAEGTYRLVRRAFECQAVGPRILKGFSDPQPVYRLLSALSSAGERRADLHVAAAPLVGRNRQLEAVVEALGRLAVGEGGVIVVLGEAGVGKSRLLDESKKRAKGEIRWIEGHALSFGQRLSYWPFIEALRTVFQLAGSQDQSMTWSRLDSEVGRLFGDERAEIVPYIGTLLALDPPAEYAERVRHLDGEVLGRQIARAMRRLFERLARERPLVLVIEDLHWVDASSAALLNHLLPLALEAPLLIYVLSRPEESARQLVAAAKEAVPERVREIVLTPLSVAESAQLISHLIGDTAGSAHMRDQILYKAEGNPFFMEEVVRTLVDLDILQRDARGGWMLREGNVVIPDTIQGVIMARVDRLDERLKKVLGIASVIGRTFFYRVLRTVSERDGALDDELAVLRSVEFIEELKNAPELAYLFRHALAHEAVYQSLLIESRKRLHDKIAACLQALYADRPTEISSLLAYHYARAENWDQALRHLLSAADQSARMAADQEALLHYEEALQAYNLAPAAGWDKTQQATIQRRLGEIFMRKGEAERAMKYFAAALGVFGDSFPEGGRKVVSGYATQLLRQFAHRLLPRIFCARDVERIDVENEAHLRTYESLAWTLVTFDQGRFILAILKILNLSERFGLVEANAKASAGFAFTLDLLGLSRLALRYHSRAVALAEAFDNPATVGTVYIALGDHHFFAGDLPRALAQHRRAGEAAWRAGDLITWSSVMMMICENLTLASQFGGSLVECQRMIDTGRDAAFHPALRWGMTARGKILRLLGRPDEARPELETARSMSSTAKDPVNLCLVHAELAYCLSALGDRDAALAAAEEGCRVAQTEQVRMHTAMEAHIALATIQLTRYEAEGKSVSTLKAAARSTRVALRMSRCFVHGRAPALRLRGAVAWHRGRRQAAARSWRSSLASAEALNTPYEMALTLLLRGHCLDSRADRERGNALLASVKGDRSSAP